MKAIRRFTIHPVLPEPLATLRTLMMNLRWSWHAPTGELFAEIDPAAWESSGHDPAVLLARVSQQRLAELATDEGFLKRLSDAAAGLDSYVTGARWYQRADEASGGPAAIAYFSPEFGITAALPQYSGGLGILAGDHLKAASDLGVPLIGVGLLYRHGYFTQSLSAEGWQAERYPASDPNGLPMTLLRDASGAAVQVTVGLAGGARVAAQVWLVSVGRVPLLLLDSYVENNEPELREVTDRLYGGGGEHRFRQELLLGIGGVRAVRAYCAISGHPQPEVFHTNEGHAGFLGIERIREYIAGGATFAEAIELTRAGTVFTTHTPVPDGIDRFSSELVERQFSSDGEGPALPVAQLLAFGAQAPGDDTFNMAVMGMRLAQRVNGVSELHGQVSRAMFTSLWPGFDDREVPIGSITNGVHAPTWVAQEILDLAQPRGPQEPSGSAAALRSGTAERPVEGAAPAAGAGARAGAAAPAAGAGAPAGAAAPAAGAGAPAGASAPAGAAAPPGRGAVLLPGTGAVLQPDGGGLLLPPGEPGGGLADDQRAWELIAADPAAIWAVRGALRARLVHQARVRLRSSWLQRGALAAELAWIDSALDENILTIGFARRVPSYKRLTMMLHDPERLASILLDAERPVQMVIAGKAHPADDGGKLLIQQLVRFADDPQLRHRIVFLPDYDMALARTMVQGCDVWLNNPLRPLEACGTSGMKAALNGALNLSVLDGWWDEWFDGGNGWAIPSADSVSDPKRRDELESTALYDLLSLSVAPLFYDAAEDGLPTRWLEMVTHTLRTLGPKVQATRMVRQYTGQMYQPASQASRALDGGPGATAGAATGFAGARALAQWKQRVAQAWPGVRIELVEADDGELRSPGSALTIRAGVALGELSPADVKVEVVYGAAGEDDEIAEPATTPLAWEEDRGTDPVAWYCGGAVLGQPGPFGYTVRVLPSHPLLTAAAEMGLVTFPVAPAGMVTADLR